MLRLPYCYWPAFGLTSDEMDALGDAPAVASLRRAKPWLAVRSRFSITLFLEYLVNE